MRFIEIMYRMPQNRKRIGITGFIAAFFTALLCSMINSEVIFIAFAIVTAAFAVNEYIYISRNTADMFIKSQIKKFVLIESAIAAVVFTAVGLIANL